jgi:hypothetical protein
MKDEQMQSFLDAWYRDHDEGPRDASDGVFKVVSRVPQTRQRSRWWPFPVLYRRTQTPTVANTTEYQPSPIPAINGHTPTAIRRTQSMLSPAKALTAGAIVFAIGGVLLVAQPFDPQAGVPGAEVAEYTEPVEFTAVITPGPWVSHETCEVVGDWWQCQGEAWAPEITDVSDPRLDGEMTDSANTNKWPGQPMLAMETIRITNEDGAWQGSFPSVYDSYDESSGAMSVVLVGEGGYEGLYAWMDVTDWSAINGVVFSYPPPEAPAPPSAN